jgi:rod shape-determining protein MreD
MARRTLGASALQRIDKATSSMLPAATTAWAMLFSIQPIPIPGYAALTPAFTLMAAYHWTIYRPNLLPPLALFIIGTTQDLLTGAPPGVTALFLLLARALVQSHRDHFVNRPFPFIWAGFTMLTGAAMLFLWSLHSLLAAELLGFRGTVFRAVLTISLFPVASFLLGRIQRSLMGDDAAGKA